MEFNIAEEKERKRLYAKGKRDTEFAEKKRRRGI
jgi:hypothetical protein